MAKSEKRQIKGRFVKGQSGNPKGMPKGVRHRMVVLREQVLDILQNPAKAGATKSYLQAMADDDRRSFASFAKGVLPRDDALEVKTTGPVQVMFPCPAVDLMRKAKEAKNAQG